MCIRTCRHIEDLIDDMFLLLTSRVFSQTRVSIAADGEMGGGAVPEGGLVRENEKTRACSQAKQTPARGLTNLVFPVCTACYEPLFFRSSERFQSIQIF